MYDKFLLQSAAELEKLEYYFALKKKPKIIKGTGNGSPIYWLDKLILGPFMVKLTCWFEELFKILLKNSL